MKRVALILAGLATAVALTGCANDTVLDYEEGIVKQPDSVTVWNNIDGHANIARVCIEGIAFLTTTRKGQDALERFPEWDAACTQAPR